jgi:hypothetical protein
LCLARREAATDKTAHISMRLVDQLHQIKIGLLHRRGLAIDRRARQAPALPQVLPLGFDLLNALRPVECAQTGLLPEHIR